MRYASGTYHCTNAMVLENTEIEGREYEPQHRTIKTNLGSKYYSFPLLQFNKYFWKDALGDSFYFYTISTVVKGKLKTINLPNMNKDGSVCLGKATDNCFYTSNSLTLDEFVDLFWFARFREDIPKTISLRDIVIGSPSLWMDEKYNLNLGWVKV